MSSRPTRCTDSLDNAYESAVWKGLASVQIAYQDLVRINQKEIGKFSLLAAESTLPA